MKLSRAVLLAAGIILLTRVCSASVWFWGDSFTWGIDGDNAGSRVAQPWPSQLCQTRNWSCTNYGVPGSKSRDIVYPSTGAAGAASPGIYQHTVLASETHFLTVGINDLRTYGLPFAATLQNFQVAQLADAAFLAIPDNAKINPRSSSQVSLSGGWQPSPAYAIYSEVTSTQGASAVFSGTGGSLLLAFTRFDHSAASWNVSVDGNSVGVVSEQRVRTQFDPDGFDSNAFLFTGLGSGNHTVILTLDTPAGDAGYWDWAAFLPGAPATNFDTLPHLYIGSVQKQTSSSYTTCPGGVNACSDRTTAALNSVLKTNAATLVANGLNVTYIDSFNYVDPSTDAGFDGLHDTQAGYTKLAGYWETCLATDPPQMCMGDNIVIRQSSPVSISGAAGETVPITYVWEGGPTETTQTAFVHLVDEAGAPIFSADFVPSLPTTAWSGTVTSRQTITIPPNLAPGTYFIDVGLYSDGLRLTMTPGPGVTDQGYETYEVGTLTVPTARTSMTVNQASPDALFGTAGSSVSVTWNWVGNPQSVLVRIFSTDFAPLQSNTISIPSAVAPGTYNVEIAPDRPMLPGPGVIQRPGGVYQVATLTVLPSVATPIVMPASPSRVAGIAGSTVPITLALPARIQDAGANELASSAFVASPQQAIYIPPTAIPGTYAIVVSADSAVTLAPGVTDLGDQTYQVGTLTVLDSPKPITPEPSTPSVVTATPGSAVQITYNWSGGPAATPQTVSVDIVDANGAKLTGNDFVPSIPTTAWNGLISLPQTISIPSTVAPGTYTINVGLSGSDTRLAVGTLEVLEPFGLEWIRWRQVRAPLFP